MKSNRRGVAPVPAHRDKKQYQFVFQLSISCIPFCCKLKNKVNKYLIAIRDLFHLDRDADFF